MSTLLSELQALTAQFTILPEQIQTIAERFRQAMLAGLAGKPSTLKMLPSYLAKPSTTEVGTFLALDFGGTNLRVLLAELMGQGKFTIHANVSSRLKDPNGAYNYISSESTADELFDFIADKIASIITPNTTYPLGHTFSFPTHQTGLNQGTLIAWTKEIETTGMEGKNITQLLNEALARKNIRNVIPQAIINDTVGALLTAAYVDPSTHIGSICGTGHNTAYVEPISPLTKAPMIINMESGNFNELPITSYDEQLDRNSEKPGAQILEKMASGHYIGEVIRLIACSLFDAGLLSASNNKNLLAEPYILNGAHASLLLEDNTANLTHIGEWLKKTFRITNSSLEDRKALRKIAALVCTRSARLVAATYLGIIKHIDPHLAHHHNIAIDGSVYEKIPGYAAEMDETLAKALDGTKATAKTSLTKDGSGIGAAIATAVAVSMNK